MKFLITGLPPEADAAGIKEAMQKHGAVLHAEIVQNEGTKDEAWAIVEMAVTPDKAFDLTTRFAEYWYQGRYISLRILNH